MLTGRVVVAGDGVVAEVVLVEVARGGKIGLIGCEKLTLEPLLQ